MEIYLLSAALGLSLGLNIYLFKKFRDSKKAKGITVGAQEMLERILKGRAILDIKVINPGNFMLISKEWDN